MPKIRVTRRFRKSYDRLPQEVQARVKKALRLLAEDPRHPSLQAKPMEGAAGIYEARVDRDHRLTYQRLPGDVLLIRVVGKHDKTLGNP